jgi:hypothetical protein
MKLGNTSRVLLLLAFLAGQVFAFAHATRHDLFQHAQQHCETCTLAHASPVPPAPLRLAAQALPQQAPLPALHLVIADRRPFERPNTRGPPSLPG